MKVIGKVQTTAKVKSFSDVNNSKDLSAKLLKSSRSAFDVKTRLQAYQIANENLSSLHKLMTRKHSNTGLGDLSGLSPDQFIDVTVTTMIKSLAGFISTERGLSAPSAKLPFINIVNTADDSVVSPNIGADVHLKSSQINYSDTVAPAAPASTVISFGAGSALVPGSVRIIMTVSGVNYTITDDSQGGLMSTATVGLKPFTPPVPPATAPTLTKVDYALGTIHAQTTLAMNPGDGFTLEASKDAPKDPFNKVKSKMAFYDMSTSPEVIISENNFITELVANKSMAIDMGAVTKRNLMEEYVKIVNDSVINPITQGYQGDVIDLNIAGYTSTYDNFESYLRLFTHGLNQVDSQLTEKSYKSVNTSCYLVGVRVAELFKSLTTIGAFVKNTEATYIDDLVGYYDGIPVVKSKSVEQNTGYALHKTSDGAMAPVCRGIFLPVNDLPEVGNFQNPTQSASGIYSYEGTRLLTSELIQKFTVSMPAGFSMV